MDVRLMTTPELSVAFSEDQLSVTVSDDQLANGLSLSPTSTNENANLWNSSDIPVVSSTAPNNIVPPNSNTSFNSTRFKVDPTSADQSVIYHQIQDRPINSQASDSNMSPRASDIAAGASLNKPPMAAIDSQSGAKPRKKVSFPEGQALIKGFAHAPNPWYNVSLCTTENLVSAYTSSCSAHSVRPLTKLITQLKSIRDFGERINLLTLKGEHLNCKHIETLEEIFRRVQFLTVDMESTHLDDESAIALFEMVEYYESAVHLRISHNKNLGLRAWVSAAKMLRRTQHLESIDLKGCSINEQCMTVLGRAIKIGACIHVLYLQECNLSGRGVLIISAALRSISTIKELHIGDNNLQPSDGIQLGNLIRNNTYLHTLDVRNNSLQDIGIAHICDGLAEQPNGMGLKSLNISNTHFTPASINVIAIALSRTKTLNTLNISYNHLANEGFFALKEGLLKNKSLCRLALRCTKLTDEGAVALAEYIADSYTISQLDIRENDIKTAGLLAISMCLKVQETITRLEIDQTVKKEPAVKDYASQQRFFLDELQSKVTQNAELQRAKLEKLLVQSQSAKSGADSVASPTTTKEALKTVTSIQMEGKTGEESKGKSDETKPPEVSSVPSNGAEADGSSYFDPLGAVSVEDGADAPVQNDGSCNIPVLVGVLSFEGDPSIRSEADAAACSNVVNSSEEHLESQTVLDNSPEVTEPLAGPPNHLTTSVPDPTPLNDSANAMNNLGPSISDMDILEPAPCTLQEENTSPPSSSSSDNSSAEQGVVADPENVPEGLECAMTALSFEVPSDSSVLSEGKSASDLSPESDTGTGFAEVDPLSESSIEQDGSSQASLPSDPTNKPCSITNMIEQSLPPGSQADTEGSHQTDTSPMADSVKIEAGVVQTMAAASSESEVTKKVPDLTMNLAVPHILDADTSSKDSFRSVTDNGNNSCQLVTGENDISEIVEGPDDTCEEVLADVNNGSCHLSLSNDGACQTITSIEDTCQSAADSSICNEQSLVDIDRLKDVSDLNQTTTDSMSDLVLSSDLHRGQVTSIDTARESSS